jgi:hypothetical protein
MLFTHTIFSGIKSTAVIPVLQVSFIKRHRSLTEEALRPNDAPIVAQSDPCRIRNLQTNIIILLLSCNIPNILSCLN